MPAVTMPAVTMPAVTMPAVTMQALAAPSAEFVGPMPAAVIVAAGSRLANAAHPATVHIPGGQAGSGQADGLSSPILTDADALEGAEGELVRADMVIARKAGQTVNGGRELFANNMDGQPGKGPRQMTETPAGASHNMAAALKQAAAQGASQILSHMPAKQAHQTAQPAPSTTDTAGQSHAGQTGGQSGGQTGGQSGGHSGGHSSAQQMADAGSARGTADRTMLHRLNTETAGWSEAMVKRLTSDLRAGVRNVRMILEPRHLGRLNVELGLRNGRASIRIAAETGEAARLLSGARGQLGQMLENSGMRLASFHASGSGAETSSDSGHGANAHAGQDGGKNAGRNQGFSNKMTNEAAGRREDEALRGLPDDALRAGETAVLSILA
jgi:flagellar hook-length control protein FliK